MTDDDYDELLQQVTAQRQQAAALLAHPDIRDPDYPEYDEGEDE